ncbi:hypothetical protein EVAR_45305_1 [Eumeta japonica]|uniref:Uncharacterized protein n=1 Tax=Eumeta variegata TaxID=151549 RepID=A0A4C1XPT1_EUMVA|nr:hypothetical protein EVAR_45305_1 [Eumeta japonica]
MRVRRLAFVTQLACGVNGDGKFHQEILLLETITIYCSTTTKYNEAVEGIKICFRISVYPCICSQTQQRLLNKVRSGSVLGFKPGTSDAPAQCQVQAAALVPAAACSRNRLAVASDGRAGAEGTFTHFRPLRSPKWPAVR